MATPYICVKFFISFNKWGFWGSKLPTSKSLFFPFSYGVSSFFTQNFPLSSPKKSDQRSNQEALEFKLQGCWNSFTWAGEMMSLWGPREVATLPTWTLGLTWEFGPRVEDMWGQGFNWEGPPLLALLPVRLTRGDSHSPTPSPSSFRINWMEVEPNLSI